LRADTAAGAGRKEVGVAGSQNGFWDILGDADDLVVRLKLLRGLVEVAAEGNKVAKAMLGTMLPELQELLADVETVLTRRN
jgi:hypothetical protein